MPGKTPQQLVLASKPYNSSNLAIPDSPFSPRSPITPMKITTAAPTWNPTVLCRQLPGDVETHCPPPPPTPMPWLWQCHVCSRCYPLGVTRRCLNDGHYFCSGTTVVKRSKSNPNKKTVRHQACQSEFDYRGYKAWGNWRRTVIEQRETEAALDALQNGNGAVLFSADELDGRMTGTKSAGHRDCWNLCDYPSDCRWRKQSAVSTPSPETTKATRIVTLPSSGRPAAPQTASAHEQAALNEFVFDFKDLESDMEDVIMLSMSEECEQEVREEKQPTVVDMVKVEKHRKRLSAGHAPSPLGSHPR